MPAKDEIGFEHKGIGAVLAHNRLAVPMNQREYSWEEEHVRELLTDFSNAIDNNKSTYFLGTLVLIRGGEDVPEISDGQQRLATTSIVLAAIRDYFHDTKDFKRAISIEQEFLRTIDADTTETVPKIRLNVDDDEFFRKFVIDAKHSTPTSRDSHVRIKHAYETAKTHIAAVLEPHHKEAQKTARLLEWRKFIHEGAEVIVLRVPDHLNAFVMFETLNDRGLKASQADLLKNYLLSYCGARIAEGQTKWSRMLATLEATGKQDMALTYLHHLIINKTGPTKEREVYDKIKALVTSQSRAVEFLEELAEGATDYAALFNADHTKWNAYGTSARKHISTINRDLRVEQIRPLMFAVARRFPVDETRKILRLFVSWSVRFLVVGGRGGLLDRNYAVRAHEIASGKITTAKKLAEAMSDIVPNDALFRTAFSEQRISQGFLARYYLRALEQKVKGEAEPEFVPMDEENIINLEHVLPENPDNKWPDFDSNTADAFYRRLGNMVLLQAKKNVLIGNSPFADKRKVLKQSAFILTAEVGKMTAWKQKSINDRQARLADLAIQTWPAGF